MKKEEERLDRFLIKEAIPYYIEHHTQLKQQIFEHKAVIGKTLIENFKTLCEDVVHKQQIGKKGTIKYIYLSALYMAIATENYEFMIEAYEETGWQDPEPCELRYNMRPYLISLSRFKEELNQRSKTYVNPKLKLEIEKLVLDYFVQYVYYFIQLARHHLEQMLDLEAFKQIQKSQDFCLMVGEYRDRGEKLYAAQNTYDTNQKALLHIANAEGQQVSSAFLRGLEIAQQDYSYYDFRSSSFEGSYITDVKMEKSLLSNTCFKEAILEHVSLKGSIIHDASFEKASLTDVNMDNIFAEVRNMEGLQVPTGCIGVQCSGAKLVEVNCSHGTLCGVDFQGASIENCRFESSDLSYCDFRNCKFEEVSFKDTILTQSIFEEKALKSLNLTKEQLKEIKVI